MNFLSRLITRDSNTNKRGIVSLSPGNFSIVRSEDSPRGHRELLFKEAEISLVSTTREFYPQIKVTDLNKEEEENDGSESIEPTDLLDLDKEDQYAYTVFSDIKLGYYMIEGRVAIVWRDIDSDDGDRFEFLCEDTVSKEALDRFDRAVNSAQYGQKYGKLPPDGAPDSIFDEFVFDYEGNVPASISNNEAKEESHLSQVYDFSEGRVVTTAECDVCVYDSVQGVFISPKLLQDVKVVLLEQLNFVYFMEVRNTTHALIGTPVPDTLNQVIDASNNALIFNYEGENKVIMSYLIRFRERDTLYKFENALTIAQYEVRNRVRWNEVPEEQQDYLMSAINGFNIRHNDSEVESDEDEEDEDADMIDVDSQDPNAESNERNSALEVGHVNDRTYVVRGNKIGVFKNTDRDLKYSTTIDNIGVDPSRIMLHEQDRALVIQSKDNTSSLYRMDLETGKIIDEWDTGRTVNDFNPISKFAQTTAESNLFGVASQSMFRIDPRINGGKISSDAEKAYKTNIGLSNVVTTAQGYLVVGNMKGELRLYNQLGKIAKTLIPGLGEPFVGIDVTSDGRFVLATCERFLLLIETASAENNGFTKSLGNNSRVRPIRLAISPENVVYMNQQSGQPIKFTTARFNTSVDGKEATIVTSTGPYLVIWSLNRVLRGEQNAYRIKKYTSQITSENFKFGTDQRVILTLEDDVSMVAKSALKSPDTVLKPCKK